MKMLEYETANPGVDFDEREHEPSHTPTIISLQQSSDPLQPHRTTGPLIDAAEADPDGVKATSGTHATGKGRQRRTSLLKGGRKQAGLSSAGAAQKGSEADGTDVYDAASDAEMGHLSNGAKK